MTQINNPHQPQPTSINYLVKSLFKNRQLIYQLTKREVIGRYKGSMLGIAWSFFTPVLMLSVYTFVFTEVFKSRWGGSLEEGDKAQFAIILFAGLIVYGIFSEVVTRSPSLISSNINFVKKVVFPLEILPAVAIGCALFHACISLLVLLLAFVVFNGYMPLTVFYIPIVLLPFVILILGLSLILASLGVYLRDIGQTVGIFIAALMFLSPIFFPASSIPKQYQILIILNPLTFIIEQAREVLIWGNSPNWVGLIIYLSISIFITWIGYFLFQKTRKGFSDVL